MIQKTSKSYKTEAESSSEHTEIPKLEGYDLYLFIAYEETSADVSSLTIWSCDTRFGAYSHDYLISLLISNLTKEKNYFVFKKLQGKNNSDSCSSVSELEYDTDSHTVGNVTK